MSTERPRDFGCVADPSKEACATLAMRTGDQLNEAFVREQIPVPTWLARGALLAGTFEIGALIGSGGMGTVYEARDRLLNRRVAIKVLHASPGLPTLRKEAQALAAIRHPSTVVVYQMGEHDGHEFLVMELVHGVSLERHIEVRAASKQPFSVEEVLEIVQAVAEGLAAARMAGVSHRDVKPANILLAGNGRVVLLDFGLVRPEFVQLLPDEIAGSPQYMAPEAIRGSVRPGDGQQVDLYALGVIAYEMLAGAAPFAGGSVAQILKAHLDGEVPDIRDVRAEVPAALAGLVMDLMAKDSAERPPSAEYVVWQLRHQRRAGASTSSSP